MRQQQQYKRSRRCDKGQLGSDLRYILLLSWTIVEMIWAAPGCCEI